MTRPTVRLIINVNGRLIGEADSGAAIHDRNIRLADTVRDALREAGYTEATLVLDAEESNRYDYVQ